MNCWRTRQLLAAYLDGELSPSETELIDEHVRVCPECAELKERIAAIPPLELPRLEPNVEADVWARMDDALEAAWERNERQVEPGWTGAALAGLRGWLRRGRVAVPVPVAAVYITIVLGLTGVNLVTFQQVRDLSAELGHRTQAVTAPTVSGSTGASILDAPGVASTEKEARLPIHGLTATVGIPARILDRDEAADEELPRPSIPVHDATTGAVIYYAVDHGYAIGY